MTALCNLLSLIVTAIWSIILICLIIAAFILIVVLVIGIIVWFALVDTYDNVKRWVKGWVKR